VWSSCKIGAAVEIGGMNEASATLVERLAVHDRRARC
jgi:hypothetical protein